MVGHSAIAVRRELSLHYRNVRVVEYPKMQMLHLHTRGPLDRQSVV